jgi:hypothetical protein
VIKADEQLLGDLRNLDGSIVEAEAKLTVLDSAQAFSTEPGLTKLSTLTVDAVKYKRSLMSGLTALEARIADGRQLLTRSPGEDMGRPLDIVERAPLSISNFC